METEKQNVIIQSNLAHCRYFMLYESLSVALFCLSLPLSISLSVAFFCLSLSVTYSCLSTSLYLFPFLSFFLFFCLTRSISLFGPLLLHVHITEPLDDKSWTGTRYPARACSFLLHTY